MLRQLFVFFIIVFSAQVKSQCPLIYDYLGNLSTNPTFISCTGNAYALNFQSNSSWGTYTLNWGDASLPATGASYAANSILSHTYAATTATYNITLTIPSQTCLLTGFVANEQPVFAGVVVAGGVALACAPKTLTFTNVSTFTSATTSYTWNFGDGSPPEVHTYTNSGQNVVHTYQRGTVNCQTQVLLQAMNYCTFGSPTSGQVNPLYVYDIDDAIITPDQVVRCFPDNTFSFSNTTARNCVPQGNTFQRQERWNFGDNWSMGADSIIGWNPWPPTSPITITYPGLGTYTVTLQDSNQCGVDIQTLTVSIVNPPVSSLIIPTGNLCQNTSITFTNLSTSGQVYRWNFGDGGGFVNLGAGNKSHTYVNAGNYTVQLITEIPGGGGACSDTAKGVVVILAAPVSDFSLTPSVGCNSLSNVPFTDLSTGASAWNWNFANTNTSTLQTPPTQNYGTPGTFVVSLIVTATTSCVHTKTASIVIRPKPVPDFSQFSACVGSAVTFTNLSTPVSGVNAITGYTWTFGDASGNSTTVSPVHTYSTAGTFTVKLKTNTAFCSDSISKTVTINVRPTANFITTPTVGCPALIVTFSNTSANASNYLWRLGVSPTSTSSITNPTFTYSNTTQVNQNYTITLIATTGIGCADSISKVILVWPKPVPNFTSNSSAGCSPFVTSFTNTSIGASTFSWTFGDGGTSVLPDPVHTYTNTSLFQQTVNVTMVATNSTGCTDMFTMSIIVYPKPTVTVVMVPSSGCHPLVVNFPALPGVATYTWNHGDGSPTLITSVAPHVHTYTNAGVTNMIYTVSLIASNGSGCSDMAIGQVTVFPKPIVSLVNTPTTGCSPLLSILTATSNIANTTYSWTFGDGASQSTLLTPTVVHTFTNASNTANQTYTSSLVVSTTNGCQDTAEVPFLIFHKPLATFTPDTPRCASTIISFSNGSMGGSTYSWTFGDGSPLSTQTSPSHTYTNNTLNNQTFSVTLVVTTISQCKDTAYGQALVYSLPKAQVASSPTAGCMPFVAVLSSTSTNTHTHFWKFSDGGTSTASTTVHTFTNSSYTLDQPYSYTLTASNNNGCSDSVIKNLLVYPKPFADFTLDTPTCSPKVITFSNRSIGASTFKWDLGNNVSSTASSTVAQNYVNSTTGNLFYSIKLFATNANNCSDTNFVTVIIYPKPVFFITALPDSGCSPLKVSFSKITGVTRYQWTFEPGNFSQAGEVRNTFVNTDNTPKNYTIQLIADDIHKCVDTAYTVIKVSPKPTAKFSASPLSVYIPNQATKCFNFSSGASSYFWSFGDGGVSEERDPIHTYGQAGEFQIFLIASNDYGCKDTAYLPEKVIALSESSAEFPNAFSPSVSGSHGTIYDPEDTSNDIFHPNIKGAEQYVLSIYSRWGELLFETKDPAEGWDGYYKGQLCTQDVYVWKIVATFVDGKRVVKTGDVLLLR